jgi:LuxR family maltose regulon positive regulatory protein
VPTAVRASRAFVREVCDRWGLQELAEPAALLASELVTNAVVHARTAMELRVKLRGPRLHVDVRDQDPNLVRLLAAKEGGDRGRGLAIVDQVASAWGVRQRRAGGKTVWCTLDLPVQHAVTNDGGPQLPASIGTAATAGGTDREDRGAANAVSAPGLDLVRAKLVPPTLRAGLLPRVGLQSLLQADVQARLCLVAAPAGSGKTTLLTQWRAAAGGSRVAWVSLDEGDNDPTRFWLWVVEALRTVEPSLGVAALAALRGPSVDLDRVVLPSLLGELAAVESQLVLVLNDYHLVTDATCLHTLGLFLEHLPAGVHLVLSTRVDPPLPLARLRARGELAELRVADLRFTGEEASELLNSAMGLRLAADDVERLVQRTEGWAAGLVLAGLALRGRQDPSAFIASFHGDDRHVAGYLVGEVLARQPEQVRTFLLWTSVLERLSGPLCDAVLETEGSAALLGELEPSNLLLVPLDDRREWYRYQQLFAQLLRLELSYREAALVPLLHRRAAAWHRQAGNLEEASHHATAAESSPKPTR